MKNFKSSDINTMLQSGMNNSVVRLAMPVTTAVIWGLNMLPGGDSAIWGTSAWGGTNTRQDFSAIWGTSGIWAPMQHAGTAFHAEPARPSVETYN